MDKSSLKIQALLEKISSLTTNYENQVADLRVELTMQGMEKDAEIATLRAQLEEATSDSVAEESSDSATE